MKGLLSAPLSPRKIIEYLLLFLLLASIISAAAYGGYWYGKQQVVTPLQTVAPKVKEPTPPKAADETAGWKSYSNEILGISFRYPAGEVTLQETGTGVRLLRKFSYIFEVVMNNTQENVDEWWSRVSKDRVSYTKTTTEFKGVPAYLFKHNSLMQVPGDMYVVKTTKGILEIGFSVRPVLGIDYGSKEHIEKWSKQFDIDNKPIVDGILPTFRFLD